MPTWWWPFVRSPSCRVERVKRFLVLTVLCTLLSVALSIAATLWMRLRRWAVAPDAQSGLAAGSRHGPCPGSVVHLDKQRWPLGP